jgi:regulator of cell morphogenesis and NO signaling
MMIRELLDTPVGQLVTERPGRSRVFERLGIDYCCGGKRPLEESCERLGLDAESVRQALAAGGTDSEEVEVDWTLASMSALAEHIVTAHHQHLRVELPRLALQMRKVVIAHGAHHPELLQLEERFGSFWSDLEAHMNKEETVLFPLCRALETARVRPSSPCGSIRNPIHRMVTEHEDAGDDLAAMRALTGNFTPPADACPTYRMLLEGLVELERDTHLHVHKENNILFPRATAAEAALAPSRGEGER